jgi:hypothetical protein
MRATHPRCLILAAAAAASMVSLADAQPARPATIDNDNRLFQNFVEDGAVPENGWFEGQFRFQSFEDSRVFSIQPVLAVAFAEDFEVGGRFGLATVDPERGGTESGFTDLDLYGKVRLSTKPTQVSVGILLELPTGEEDKSLRLGTGELDIEFFGGLRRDFGAVSLVGSAGMRVNQDPEVSDPDALREVGLPGGSEAEGETSVRLGGALLFAMTARLVGQIEVSYETERIDDLGSDLRVTVGGEYRLRESFALRIALAAGQGDGAPDYEAIASTALLF